MAGGRSWRARDTVRPDPGWVARTALALAEAGARVACLDLDRGRAEAVAEEVRAGGGDALAVVADVTSRGGVDAAFAQVVDAFGGVDVLVDIIGEARWGSVLEFTDDDWEWSIATNLRQAFLLMQAGGKQMVAQGAGGAMAFVASVDGLFAATNHLAYGAAKAGLLNLVKTFAQELGPERIRVNAVLPGAVGIDVGEEAEATYGGSIQPLRHPNKDDIAKALTFFVSDLASGITGQSLPVDGGASIKSPWGGAMVTPPSR